MERGLEEPSGGSAVWAACCCVGGVTGFACFEADTCELWVTTGADDEQHAFAALAIQHASPRAIYVSAKASEELLAALSAAAASCEPPGEVKIESSACFAAESTRSRLYSARIVALPQEAYGTPHHLHALNALIRLDAEAQVRAAGALLGILQRDGLLADTGSLAVICERSLSGFLTVDAESMEALGILVSEVHPTAAARGTSSRRKEGLSVLGLLDTCHTPAGKRQLRLWLRRPLLDEAALNARLDAISFLLSNPEEAQELAAACRRIKDIPRLLARLATPAAFTQLRDWRSLRESLAASIQLGGALRACSSDSADAAPVSALFSRLEAGISVPTLRGSHELLCSVIEFEVDETEGAADPSAAVPQVAAGVCEQLDELKTLYLGLPHFLTTVAERERLRFPPSASGITIQVLYCPKVGHVVRLQGLPQGTDPLPPSLAAILPDYVYAFAVPDSEDPTGGRALYFFSDSCRALDVKFGDLYNRMLDLEASLLQELKLRVLAHAPALLAASRASAEADCILALTRAASAFGLTRPKLTTEPVLRIDSGRHLLVQRVVEVFVPNSIDCGQSTGRVCVITGPNSSGKSVFLKQTALIVFLAHCGSFVPADAALVGICDRIFTRLNSSESLGAKVVASSFVRDLTQMSSLMRLASPRSLLVIDEFGKGTLPLDGLALLAACVNDLLRRQPAPPLALVATHFSELADETVLPRHPALAFLHMRILERGADASNKDLVFLYRLVPGHATGSYGLHCARLAGVPAEVLQRAQSVLHSVAAGEPIEETDDARQQARSARFARMVAQLREFDVENGDVRAFLASVCAAPEEPPAEAAG